jgi:hypothetical protein
MKTNSTHALLIRIILFILICLYSFLVFGRPGQGFRAATPKAAAALETQYTHNNAGHDLLANVITDHVALLAVDNTGQLQQDEMNARIGDIVKTSSDNYTTNTCTIEKLYSQNE